MPIDGYSYSIDYRIDDIMDVWDVTTLPELLSQSPYLRTIELDSSDDIRNLYIVIYDTRGEPIGTALYQSIIVRMSDSFNYERYASDSGRMGRWLMQVRQRLVGLINFRLMILGNLYLTGQYGFYFGDSSIDSRTQHRIIDFISRDLAKKMCRTKYRFSAILYKDYFDSERIHNPRRRGLHPFTIDPNLILDVRPEWSSFDDYLASMRSKYRIRMKNAMKKFAGVERRILGMEEVSQYHEKMHSLYESILEGSGFVLAQGQVRYFKILKEQLRDKLHVVGYFYEGEMIGFYTWVIDAGKLDAHFIGVHSQLNLRHQIYLNILLDLIRDAIAHGASYVYYYRTALEIKSSVGAEPHEMTLYGRYNNRLINLLTPIALRYFVPHQHWTQRHPFRRDNNLTVS